MTQTISVSELKMRLDTGGVQLLDVRSAEELALATLPGALHIPMQELPARFGDLNPQQPLAVICHHGVRSEMAARLLERNGFSAVFSVAGGIDAWSMQVDSAVPRY
ncbi:MAG TPA: rhodanese-like domain-containing protein [Solimonas sp.]|nr:rhodanese-like domain-containing protein [Solimonas sp.]